ncbi:outer membrane beta-barrel protein [Sphingomonas sp. NBWT7]|uniref:outer membrane beta-barrel protein n=1 Tax=Sphingomonas sp. NBWT7 TaxID=2596913 RepID=UPI0018609089|nr:outer membrane beta-barrel protein [Sphingomonas sp. NBWT7]QNE31041.1 outer membrane beta-barrel protein [Sphingomonas sp. NBWT7]
MGGSSLFAGGRARLTAIAVAAVGVPTGAVAQDGLVVQPAVPQGFDRDRNVGVLQRPRPSYDALGISVGGLLFFPSVEAGGGGTTNAYLTRDNETAVPFVFVEPAVTMRSIWSRHAISARASTARRDYIGQSRRNERTWDLGASGRLDLGRTIEVTGEVQSSLDFENQFTGEINSAVAAVSRFRRNFISLRGEYTSGRLRAFVVGDYTDFRFRPLPLGDGAFRDQTVRDRNLARVTAQAEYARTPSVSVFAQVNYTSTTFVNQLVGASSRDSQTIRASAGANADIAGRLRGSIAFGYSIRDYSAATFETIRGLVAEGRLDLFPSEQFTITATARRTIEDSTFGNRQPFWDNRFGLRGDYEVRRNLIVSATGDYAFQNYLGSDRENSSYRALAGARLLVSRRLSFDGSISYARRRSNVDLATDNSDEGRIQAGLTYRI